MHYLAVIVVYSELQPAEGVQEAGRSRSAGELGGAGQVLLVRVPGQAGGGQGGVGAADRGHPLPGRVDRRQSRDGRSRPRQCCAIRSAYYLVKQQLKTNKNNDMIREVLVQT